MSEFRTSSRAWNRRQLMGAAALGGLGVVTHPAWAETVDFQVPGGPSQRPTTTSFPEKGRMVVQRTRPPWLETPFDVFDKGVFTPNDQHFVSWHWASFPTDVDLGTFRLNVHGHVEKTLSLSLHELMNAFPRIELAAVNQCAGNSRLYMQPRIAGAQWANGSMSNAKWTGVSVRDILDRAGVKSGALRVRFGGLDEPVLPDAPKFMKSITVDHARDGEVLIAFGMNDEQLPMLNGFPLRLVVPGWSGVYWIKALNDIEVLDQPDMNYWNTTGYRVPNTPNYTVAPGDKDFELISVTHMVPRSFVTNVLSGASLKAQSPNLIRGFAFGGDCGVAKVDLSIDAGQTWMPTTLGVDEGKYGFRRWQTTLASLERGAYSLMVRCTNTKAVSQPMTRVWNPGGYLNNTVETTAIMAA